MQTSTFIFIATLFGAAFAAPTGPTNAAEGLVDPIVAPAVQPFVKPVVKPDVHPDVKPDVHPIVKPDVHPIVAPNVEPHDISVAPVVAPAVLNCAGVGNCPQEAGSAPKIPTAGY